MGTATGPGHHEQPQGLAHCGRLAYVEERLGVTSGAPTRAQRVRRALFYVVLTWVAPFALSFLPNRGAIDVPFALDVEAHVRGLFAVPMLLLAEWPIEQRLRAVMRRLGSPPLTPERGRGRALLGERVHWARRVAGHPLAEGALVLLAFFLGYQWLLGHERAGATWIATPRDGVMTVTAAGAWEAAVVVPAYAFLLLRWLWRWVVLAALFARVSRLPLRLVPNHGDRAAGLGFLSEACVVFGWVLFAASAVASAKWMDAILYVGFSASGLVPVIQGIVAFGVVWAFLPLVAFVPLLTTTRRKALRRYTDIVAKHGAAVERRWVAPDDRVTADDAGSMADLNSVHAAVRGMRVLPVALLDVVVVALATLVPLTPIVVRIIPARELLSKLLGAFL